MQLRNLSPLMCMIKEGWEKAFFVGKAFCFLHVTNTYLFFPTFGPSMLPTLDITRSVLFVETISTRLGKVACGDIVVVRSPENPRKFLTKRLVGMEGDSVTFISNPKNSDKPETIVVPKGHVWVQGDNIYNSRDSRQFGSVPYDLVQGKVFGKAMPLEDFGPIWNK